MALVPHGSRKPMVKTKDPARTPDAEPVTRQHGRELQAFGTHLLFDKHCEEQVALVDALAERIMMLGGLSVAMPADVAEMSLIPRPPKGREEVPVMISRLL